MKPEVLTFLQEMSFTEYEAKAYLTLLEKSPLSGYAVSLNSGVPRSKIYEVLGGMVSRGDILVSQESTPLYVPLPPNELIAQRKRKAEQVFADAQQALEQYTITSQNRESIWNIAGGEAIINRIREGVKGARHRILLEMWKEDAEELREDLERAAKAGVRIVIVAYGELDFDFADVYPHDSSAAITSDYGGRWVVFSADDREVIAGILSLGDDSRAAWTLHPGLVMPITEVIIHDLYLMEIMREFREPLEAKFGPDLIDLRNKFYMGPNGKKYYLPDPGL
ncbi:TrmB family transcriptional regulator [Paenibacillus hodogayensis]|uniref:TrmB family transcriptional regulator n=1 Tax=Paenibacillus hodogayensis TaxID=279208 RepID=A0ABV5VZT9_9BACL